MNFRFTLTHAIAGSATISEPDGWKNSVVGMDRHPDFHSLIESYESNFRFYGSNGSQDGFRDWILNLEKLYGADDVIEILIEWADDDMPYTTLFEGELGLGALVENVDLDHTVEIPITQIGFWTNFLNRYSTPINILDTKDQNGATRLVMPKMDVSLKSQTLKSSNRAHNSYSAFGGSTVNDKFVQIGFDTYDVKEIQQTFEYATSARADIPFETIYADYDGNYNFSNKLQACTLSFILHATPLSLDVRGYASTTGGATGVFEVRLALNGNDIGVYSASNFNLDSSANHKIAYTEYTLNLGIFLKKGDKLTIYAKRVDTDGFGPPFIVLGKDNKDTINYLGYFLPNVPINNPAALFSFPDQYSQDNYLNIDSLTTYPATDASGFFIHDVASAIADRIIGADNTLLSNYLGSPYTATKQYPAVGCGSLYMLFKGLQIRQYTLDQKPFYMSFEDWWKGANPILNLGLGYDTVNGQTVLVVEDKAKFYDNSDFSIKLSNVKKIKRTYDETKQFTTIKAGYNLGKSEDIGGLDDPQQTTTRSTRFKKIGKPFEIVSSWIAASLLFEQARRTTQIKSADYKYDDNNFVLAVVRNAQNMFVPETDENFNNVTNLVAEGTRYNKRLTPARNFVRWLNYLSGCLQKYTTSVFKFAGGEGNYDMQATMTNCAGPYLNVPLSEKQDIPVSTNVLFTDQLYDLEHYLTKEDYEVFKTRRHYALGISQSELDHKKFHIKTFKYEPGTGALKVSAWAKEPFDLQVIADVAQDIEMPTCSVVGTPQGVFDDTFDNTFN